MQTDISQETIRALKNMHQSLAQDHATTKEIAEWRKQWEADTGEKTPTELFAVKKKLGLSGRSLNMREALQTLDNAEIKEFPMEPSHQKNQLSEEVSQASHESKTSGLRTVFGEAGSVPSKAPGFVSFGCYNDVKKVIKSGIPMTVWITGEKGYGKTLGVTQACAETGVPLAKISITSETTEDDLVGGLRIIDGSTVFQKSAMIHAMENGYPVLLDEIDLGGSRIMALQGVLDHSGVLIKKTGEFVKPAPGFQVFMTSNTGGHGDLTGDYVHTQILNGAFMDRVDTIINHGAPTEHQEAKILREEIKNLIGPNGNENVKLETADELARWASSIRKNVNDGILDEEVSTRAMCKVIKNMAVFGGTPIKNICRVINKSADDEWINTVVCFFDEIVSSPEEDSSENIEN